MGKKSLRAKKWFGRGGHQRYAGRPVDADLLNTTTRASERVPDVTFEVTKRAPGRRKVVEAGTFTRASEETLRQRRIVSAAGRFKGGGAPGGSGSKAHREAPARLFDRVELKDMEAHREKLVAELVKQKSWTVGGAGLASNKELMDRLEATKIELTDETRPRAISVALANARAAINAIPSHRESSVCTSTCASSALPYRTPSGDTRTMTDDIDTMTDYELNVTVALVALRETVVLNNNDRADFGEYLDGLGLRDRPAGPEFVMETIASWHRLRKHWPRMRRRICSYCGKRSDPSEPRLLVCGGCGEGRGVGRYCSVACQRDHWPEHQKKCSMFHATPHTMLRNKSGRDSFLNGCMESIKNGLTLEEAVEDRLCKSML